MRSLFPSQEIAMEYTNRVRHPALFLEMRLGKTLVTVRQIMRYTHINKILIVAPNSALGSWEKELILEKQNFIMLLGTRHQRQLLLKKEAKFYLINKEGHLSLPEIALYHWDVVVLDESTFIKNPKAKVTKFFLRNFRSAYHRWILAGRPNPESDLDLFCQFAFLDGNMFNCKNYYNFRSRYFELKGYDWIPKLGAKTEIKKFLAKRACIVRRQDVQMDNQKVYIKRELEFPKSTQETYTKLESDFVIEFGDHSKETIWQTAKYTWLRRLCDGFIDEEMIWDGKIIEIISLLKNELKNEKVIIWYNFNNSLIKTSEILTNHNIKNEVLHGRITPKNRKEIINKFQIIPDLKILLIQQAVAQMGLDLSISDTAIYFSSPSGLLARIQTEDRIVHPSKKHPLLFIDLVVKNTVNADLCELIQDKNINSSNTLERAILIKLRERYSQSMGHYAKLVREK